MKKKFFLITFLIILILGVIFTISYSFIFKDKEYIELENKIEETVSNFLGQYINEYPKIGEKKINITDVINKGYKIDMYVNDDACDGYVVVKKVSIAYEYDGYIKCNNYITEGY